MTLLVFILVLSVLILVHEFGHFIAAKKSGVKVEEFGLGLPPRLIGKRVGETIYSINALLFGGFVRMAGEEHPQNKLDKSRQFFFQSKKVKAVIISAGVAMNLLLALVTFSAVYSIAGIPTLDGVKILEVQESTPAQTAGIKAEDVVIAVNNQPVKETPQFSSAIDQNKGQTVTLTLLRQNQKMEISVTPRTDYPADQGSLGVVITQNQTILFPPLWKRPFVGAFYGFKEALFWGKATLSGLFQLFSDLFGKGQVPKDLTGPVGIYQITGMVVEGGWLAVINFIGILSVNLAIVNFIPFPALDGGRLLFVVLEKFRGRSFGIKLEQTIHLAGMAFLLLLLLAITVNDVLRLTGASSVIDLFSRLLPR